MGSHFFISWFVRRFKHEANLKIHKSSTIVKHSVRIFTHGLNLNTPSTSKYWNLEIDSKTVSTVRCSYSNIYINHINLKCRSCFNSWILEFLNNKISCLIIVSRDAITTQLDLFFLFSSVSFFYSYRVWLTLIINVNLLDSAGWDEQLLVWNQFRDLDTRQRWSPYVCSNTTLPTKRLANQNRIDSNELTSITYLFSIADPEGHMIEVEKFPGFGLRQDI